MADLNKNQGFEFRDDDFVLVRDKNEKITDTKLATKPTTFFKDAFKRFCKNKSSVAGAIIVLILVVLSIVVPIVSDANIDKVSTVEKFLAPKLFEPGHSIKDGFWDGTRQKTRIVYDMQNEVPALSDKYSIASLKQSLVWCKIDEEPTLIDAASPYATGGVIVVATDAAVAGRDVYMTSKPIAFTDKGGYTLDIVFDSEDGVSNSKLGEYSVYLKTGEKPEDRIVIRDFSTDYSPISVNISDLLKENRRSSVTAQIAFDVKSTSDSIRYVLVKSVMLNGGERAKNLELLQAVSFDDASEMINISDVNSDSYWSCSGRKGIHNAQLYYCDYSLDTYMLVYGNADPVTYSATELNTWIANGWCKYDYTIGPESFELLDDRCPLDVVDSQSVLTVTKKLSSVTGRSWGYRKLGYDSMPKFLLGTDASGFDLVKRAFSGLLTSLILGVVVSAFCFAFGLVWGSISGYFGGRVDLYMERFCEILGGVPSLVVLTLAILHFGNNFGTFVFALCITGWMGVASRTRTQFYRFKGREYVLASRTLGASDTRLIFRHILPNSMGTIITSAAMMIPGVIGTEASLAFLNLGLQGSRAFGVMLSNNQQYLSLYPNLELFPATIIALLMISFNLFSNGLRDAFNPSLKGSD